MLCAVVVVVVVFRVSYDDGGRTSSKWSVWKWRACTDLYCTNWRGGFTIKITKAYSKRVFASSAFPSAVCEFSACVTHFIYYIPSGGAREMLYDAPSTTDHTLKTLAAQANLIMHATPTRMKLKQPQLPRLAAE